MENKFELNISTPENTKYNDNVYSLLVKLSTGVVTILANHQSTISLVKTSNIKIVNHEGKIINYSIGDGILEINNNKVNLLVDFFNSGQSENPVELRKKAIDESKKLALSKNDNLHQMDIKLEQEIKKINS
ncbi:MAG: F0F1 ATP synthase subunit epsilon [Mycoplasmataceae bacterium]|jgi:F0F1-type ATP synthase epsilon subunit|nr:F0F1 ATP synthase subunit epsilon [Mycoplasmataceae bacterium]